MGRFKVKKGGRRTKAREAARVMRGSYWVLRTLPVPANVPVRPGLLMTIDVLESAVEGTLTVLLTDPVEPADIEHALTDIATNPDLKLPGTLLCEDRRVARALRQWSDRFNVVVDDSPVSMKPLGIEDIRADALAGFPAPPVLPGRERQAGEASDILLNFARHHRHALPMTMEFSGPRVRPEHRFGLLVHGPFAPVELVLGPSPEDANSGFRRLEDFWQAFDDHEPLETDDSLTNASSIAIERVENLDESTRRFWTHHTAGADVATGPEVLHIARDGSASGARNIDLIRSATLALEAAAAALSPLLDAPVATSIEREVTIDGDRLTVSCIPCHDHNPPGWNVPFRTLVSASGEALLHELGALTRDAGPTPLLVIEATVAEDINVLLTAPGVDAIFVDGNHLDLLLQNDEFVHITLALGLSQCFIPGEMAGILHVSTGDGAHSRPLHIDEILSSRVVPVIAGPPSRTSPPRLALTERDGFRRPSTSPPPEDLLRAHPTLRTLTTIADERGVGSFIESNLRFSAFRAREDPELCRTLAISLCRDRHDPIRNAFLLRSLIATRVVDVRDASLLYTPLPQDSGNEHEPLARLLAGHWDEDDAFTPHDPEAGDLHEVAIPRQRQAQPHGFLPGPGLALVATPMRSPIIVDGIRLSDDANARLSSLLETRPWSMLPETGREPFRTLWLLDGLNERVPREDPSLRGDDEDNLAFARTLAHDMLIVLLFQDCVRGAPHTSLAAIAALADLPPYRDMFKLLLHHFTQGHLRSTVLGRIPRHGDFVVEFARRLGRLPSGEPLPEVDSRIARIATADETSAPLSPAERALAHAQWIVDSCAPDLRAYRIAFLLLIARLTGFLDRCPSLDRFATDAARPALRRAAGAVGVAATELAPAHLPTSAGDLLDLPSVGAKTLATLAELVEQSLRAGAASAASAATQADDKQLAEGLEALGALFADEKPPEP